jgi:Flp pilus assembly protein TadD
VHAADALVDGLQALLRGERALVMQGRRAYDAGRFQDAAAAFAKALAAAPASATARANLGLALLAQQGRDSEAVDHLRVAFRQTPDDASVRSGLLRGLLRLGRDDEAITVLTGARTLDPDDEEMLVTLSILLAHRHRYVEAVAVLEEGNRRFPDRPTTATTLARLLASSPDRSVRNGRRALDLANGVYTAAASPVHGETVALALAELGRCDEASAWMGRAVAEAERQQDEAEVARLRGELPKYGNDCRR